MDDFPSLEQTASSLIPEMEKEQIITRTFRRLDSERQKAVIEATFSEAAESGPDHIHIKEVAKKSGASVGSLYQYFGNQDGLNRFAARLGVTIMQVLFRLSRPMLLQMPATQALRSYLTEGVKYFQGQDAYLRYFARAAYSGDPELAESVVDPVAEEMLSTVRAILDHGIQTGEFRPDVDKEATTRVIHMLLTVAGDSMLFPHLNRYFRATDKGVHSDRLIEALFQVLEHGIGFPSQANPRKGRA
jgi:AcrR family transcriptional regulator